ncbi:hypothetical protein PG993_011585 [Apiospora rasikravindrae]|uniref:Uncharacterized protein n=1 Tax=Apiospora rasikravindrae TaxID=990691 RepID=A0ABR1S016_9PEZI
MLLLCLNLLLLAGTGPVEGHPTSPGEEENPLPLLHGAFDAQDLATGLVPSVLDDGPSSCDNAWPTIFTSLDEAQYCHNFLAGLGDTGCFVPPPPPPQAETPGSSGSGPNPPATFGRSVFCLGQNGQSVVMGATFKATGTSSACRDVARGTAPENLVAGQTVAWGNGDLLVVVQQGTYLNWTAPPGMGR